MHDGAVIVRANVVAVGDVLKEIVLETLNYVVPHNCDVGVAIAPALLVPEAYGVPDLVNRIPRRTVRTKIDVLDSALHAYT